MPHSPLRQRSHVAIGATRQMMMMRIAHAMRCDNQAVSARGGIGYRVTGKFGIRDFNFRTLVSNIPRASTIWRERPLHLLRVSVRSRGRRVRAGK